MNTEEKLLFWSNITDFEKFLVLHTYIQSDQKDESILINYYNKTNEQFKIQAKNLYSEEDSTHINKNDFPSLINELFDKKFEELYEISILDDEYTRLNCYDLLFHIPHKKLNDQEFLTNVLFPGISQICTVKIEFKWPFSSYINHIKLAEVGIETLKPFILFDNLKELDLIQMPVKDLVHISTLKTLEIVKLSGVQSELNNLYVFSSLPNLKNLELKNIEVKSLCYLSNNSKLKKLKLEGTFNDIIELEKLKELESIYLNSNEITDTNLLTNFTGLKELSLNSKKIKDLSFIKNLKELTHLHLNDIVISDLKFLLGLTKLRYLHLRNNKIKNVEIINTLEKIEELDLSYNKIEKCILSNLKKLRILNLQNNSIRSIENIYLKEIIVLNISYNPLNNLKGLENSEHLVHLELESTVVVDFKPIMNWSNEPWNNIYYTGTTISDIESEKKFILAHDKVGKMNDFWSYPNNSQLQGFPSYSERINEYFDFLDKRTKQ